MYLIIIFIVISVYALLQSQRTALMQYFAKQYKIKFYKYMVEGV